MCVSYSLALVAKALRHEMVEDSNETLDEGRASTTLLRRSPHPSVDTCWVAGRRCLVPLEGG